MDGWTKSGAAELDTKAARRLCCVRRKKRCLFNAVPVRHGKRETVKKMVKW